MLIIKNLFIKSLDIDRLDLFWEIENTSEDPLDYTFTIERSESQGGPWTQLCEPFSDKYFYRDIIVNLFHKWRIYWYRIKITKKSNGEISYSDKRSQEPEPDLAAAEARRLCLIAFREHLGRIAWIFPVRTFGQRCPACYDPITKNRIRSQCLTCYDTGFAGGYMNPIQTLVQVDATPKGIEQISLTETQQRNTTARTPYFPIVKPDDIIVEAENLRWRVSRLSTSEKLRSVIYHELNLHEIPRSDIEYRIPINIEDLKNLEPSPQREFTNPQNLESTQGKDWFKNILTGYGWNP
jgi:hypothetical protein